MKTSASKNNLFFFNTKLWVHIEWWDVQNLSLILLPFSVRYIIDIIILFLFL